MLASFRGNEDLTITLYEESIEELSQDLALVNNESTKQLIQDEINYCNRRIEEIKQLSNELNK
jgi:hypothetical protein